MQLNEQTLGRIAPEDIDLVQHIGTISTDLADHFRKPSITMFDPFEISVRFPSTAERGSGFQAAECMSGRPGI